MRRFRSGCKSVTHHLAPLLGLSALLAASGWAAAAAAQTAPPVAPVADTAERARDHAGKGRKLYDLRRYDDAIREFEQAYQLDNDPAHLYNIAQAHRLANRGPEAIAAYRAYLDRQPDTPNRADVERRIAELSASQRPPNTLEPPPAGAAPPPGYPPGTAPGAYPPAPSYYPAPTPAVGAAVQAPGYHTHDGFFLRMQLGVGFTSVSAERTDIEVSGTSGHFSLAAGGTVAGKLALFGEFGGGSATNPSAKIGGQSGNIEGELTVVTFGAGAAYYFMPVNVYLSATLGGSQVTLKAKQPIQNRVLVVESKTGFGVTLSAGKEWWVARDVGLGVALQLHGSAVKEDIAVNPDTLTPGWASLVFSGTYN